MRARLAMCLAFALAVAGVSITAAAQQAPAPASTYKPTVGQEGRDVVWVPTPESLVEKMLDMAKVTAKDRVIDLGSGDGRTVIAAARRGARALGIEYNPDMVKLSQRNAEQAGVTGRAEFVRADLFETDLTQATVITLFLLPELNLKLKPRLLRLTPGTRIVSNSFDMGEWQADESATLGQDTGCGSAWCTALLWIVPAQVGGTHHTPHGELTLKQTYQMLTGTLQSEGKTVKVQGRVIGDEVVLTAGGRKLHGTLSGSRLELR